MVAGSKIKPPKPKKKKKKTKKTKATKKKKNILAYCVDVSSTPRP